MHLCTERKREGGINQSNGQSDFRTNAKQMGERVTQGQKNHADRGWIRSSGTKSADISLG